MGGSFTESGGTRSEWSNAEYVHTQSCTYVHVRMYVVGKSFQIQEHSKTQSGEESSSSLNSSSLFLNAPKSERIFPTTVGDFVVRNPYSNVSTCMLYHSYKGTLGFKLCIRLANRNQFPLLFSICHF